MSYCWQCGSHDRRAWVFCGFCGINLPKLDKQARMLRAAWDQDLDYGGYPLAKPLEKKGTVNRITNGKGPYEL